MFSKEPQPKTLLASQPIYTAQKDLFGFELFFHHNLISSATEFGEDLATSEVLLNLSTGVTKQINVFHCKVFINLSEGLLLSDAFLPLPPESVVIELPASTQITESLLNGIKKWKTAGFSFALDNFDFSSRYLLILDYIEYVKVDVLNDYSANIALKMSQLSEYPVTYIAKNVETESQFTKFKHMEFSLFQGCFLAKPVTIKGQKVRGKINNSIAIINAISQPEIEIDGMSQIVSRDPNLATQLLKIVNSPVCSLIRPMSSIREAIVYLGLIQIRKWIIMMSLLNDMMSSSGAQHLILTRAKACENYVKATLFVNSDQAFLVGLLSGTYLLFGIENELFLQQLTLHPVIVEAVLSEEGVLGQVLKEVKAVEHTILQNSSAISYQSDLVLSTYNEASDWAAMVLELGNDIQTTGHQAS